MGRSELTIDFYGIPYIIQLMRKISLQNVVWKEGKYYVAQCLNVDISSFGKTKKEALSNLEEALGLYFEDKKGFRITVVKKPVIVERQLQYA